MWRCGTFASRLKSGNRKRAPASFPPFTVTVFRAFRLLHGHVESQIGAIRYSAKVWRRRLSPLRPQWIWQLECGRADRKGPWPRCIPQGEAAEGRKRRERRSSAGELQLNPGWPTLCSRSRGIINRCVYLEPLTFIHHSGWKEASAAPTNAYKSSRSTAWR